MRSLTASVLLRRLSDAPATVVVPAPQPGPGNWAGAPYAVSEGDTIWLAYRVRRPEGSGRGLANVLARSTDGGVAFETVASLTSTEFGAASLERPALVRRPDGGWRLYVSCATPGSRHWWVEALDADTVADLPVGARTVVLPGDESEAWKDVVVVTDDDGWHLWACRHPLDDGDDEADRMSTWYATSADGLAWTFHGPALEPRPGEWDARGARVTDVRRTDTGWLALYDGRASAAENFHERTGVAVGDSPTTLTYAAGPAPAAYGRALRYASIIETSAGPRVYYETATEDGSHHLVTGLLVEA
ncbi:MAG: hypothetical protein U0Q21_01280 [Dermatophilaceae bacterium]